MSEAGPLQQVNRTFVRLRGRTLSYFGGCDYFRLASHPQVLKAVGDGLRRHGLNVAASRLTSGNHPLYEKLERQLARSFVRRYARCNAAIPSHAAARPLFVA